MIKFIKKAAAVMLAATLTAGLTACGGNNNSGSNSGNSSGSGGGNMENLAKYDVTEYNIDKYLSPYWKGRVSYAEAAFVLRGENGEIAPISLLYPIDKMVSVRSADLSTLYEEGKDYEVVNGKLVIKDGGTIPALDYSDYYHETYTDDGLKTQIPAASGKGSYIVAEISKESKGMSAWCLACTYTHAESNVLTEPEDKSEIFSSLSEKLNAGQNLKVAYYGDSITYGWAATGLADVNRAPYCPTYCDMAMAALEKQYGVKITRKNFSVSGKETNWAKEYDNYAPVAEWQPDLLILAFGMNDGVAYEPAYFAANIRNIVKNIIEKSPNTEIVVVSPMVPNDLVGYSSGTTLRKYQPEYPAELAKAESYWQSKDMHVAVADVTNVHLEMLNVKTFQDCTSSNTNHPNDYIHRLYAQVVLKTVAGL